MEVKYVVLQSMVDEAGMWPFQRYYDSPEQALAAVQEAVKEYNRATLEDGGEPDEELLREIPASWNWCDDELNWRSWKRVGGDHRILYEDEAYFLYKLYPAGTPVEVIDAEGN